MPNWTSIVEKHGPIVWKTVYRLLNHQADAEDCFQRTFVSALDAAENRTVKNWPGFLKKIATARALDRLRQRYRKQLTTSLPIEPAIADPIHQPPDVAVEYGEFSESLRQAITKLDDRQADVFCLACLEEQTYAEIAESLGISVNHVGVLLNRAKQQLQKHLRAFAPDGRF